MLEAAISYASRNLCVFPCEKKIPVTGTGGFKNATCDLKLLLEWWTKNPKAQIGIPTGQVNHLFVIDVDGPQGEAALPKLNLPETFTVETRPGRKQFWFAQPDGVTTKNSAGALAPQIDTRGDGGYIIAPPSIHHETGRPYRIVKDIPWAEMPAMLNDSLANGDGHALTTDIIPKGKRHQTLLSMAGALRARGLSPQNVLATLRTLNVQQCESPIDDADLRRLASFVGTKPAGFPGQRPVETSAVIEVECFSQIAPEDISWLWYGRIPAGKVTLFVGDPGKGKSLAKIDLAARVSCGRPFPDGSLCAQGDVLILSAEDAATDTVRPRLDAAGADVGRVHRIKAVKVTLSDGQAGESPFSLERDLEKLEETLTKHPGFKLIIIDPLSAYLGTKVNSWRDAEVRALLTPLVEFAARTGVAVVGIMHMRKSETDAMLRVSGSIAFVAAARVVWGFGEDPDNPALSVMVPVKNNLAPLGDSLGFQIIGNGSGIPYLVSGRKAAKGRRKRGPWTQRQGKESAGEAAQQSRGVAAQTPCWRATTAGTDRGGSQNSRDRVADVNTRKGQFRREVTQDGHDGRLVLGASRRSAPRRRPGWPSMNMLALFEQCQENYEECQYLSGEVIGSLRFGILQRSRSQTSAGLAAEMSSEPQFAMRDANTACILAPRAAESASQENGSMARRRFQTGRIVVRGKKRPMFVGRWREDVIESEQIVRVERSVVLGTVAELKTRKNAQRALQPFLDKVNSLDYRPAKFAKFSELADLWETQVLVLQKPSSVKASQSHLRTYIRPWLGHIRLEDFTCQAQQNFVTRLSRGISRKTVLNVLCTLISILRSAKKWNYCCHPIVMEDLELPKDDIRKKARFFNGDEARKIIMLAVEPYRTMFAIAAMTGLRVGEVLGLQKADLDFDRRIVHVIRSAWYGRVQTVKSRASSAPVAMSGALASALEEYLATWRSNTEGFLFVNRNGRPYAANKVVEYGLWPVLDKLQIPRCGMHAFRHCHASLLMDVGANPTVTKEQMRHSDARVTLGIYGHVIGDKQREAVDKVGEILRPSAPKSEKASEYIQ